MPGPPSEAGAVQDRVTRPLPGVAVSPVGAPGAVIAAAAAAGVADAAPDGGPSPTLLTAVTLK